jgi:hypothetical protein
MRRRVIREAGRRDSASLQSAANEQFGLPEREFVFWSKLQRRLPWRAPEGSAPSPRLLVSGDR